MPHALNIPVAGKPGETTPALDGLGCRAAIMPTRRLAAGSAAPLLTQRAAILRPASKSTDAADVPARTRLGRKHPAGAFLQRPGHTPTHTPLTHGPDRSFVTLACTAGVAFFLRHHGAQA